MKYKIVIDDTHIIDGEKEESRAEMVGNVSFLTKGYKIHYKENGTGYEGCFVTLDFDENTVTVKRSGALNSQMIIEKNVRHLCPYATPAGIMDLAITGTDIQSSINKNGGTLLFCYIIDVNGDRLSENKLRVNIERG